MAYVPIPKGKPLTVAIDEEALRRNTQAPWIKQDLFGTWRAGMGKEPGGLLDGYKDPQAAAFFGQAKELVDNLRRYPSRSREEEVNMRVEPPSAADRAEANNAFERVYSQLMRRGLI